MAKQIPVFSFVFAAFAATSIKSQAARQIAESIGPGEASAALLETWRLLWRRQLEVSARVSAAGDSAAEAPWLSAVGETRDGLFGLVCEGQAAPEPMGKRVRFDLEDVLDWRIVAPQSVGEKLSRSVGGGTHLGSVAGRQVFALSADADGQ